MLRFIQGTEEITDHILERPFFLPYENKPHIRHGILHKNVSLFYRVIETEQVIELLLFWDNRKDPSSKKL